MTSRVSIASVAALALTVAVASVSASGPSTDEARPGSPAALASPDAGMVAPAHKASPTPFTALARVNAVPMSSGELEAIKGQHIHFVTPSANDTFGEVGLHLVNRNNTDNWIDFGTGPAGPGYHGLCGAALRSPALWIPGQNPTTGVGAGC